MLSVQIKTRLYHSQIKLKRFGRLERPMILFDKKGEAPQFLFGATQGGTFETSTTFVFEITTH